MTCYFQQCGMCDQQSLRPACAYAQPDQSLCLSLEYSMSVKLLTEHRLRFLSLIGECTGSSESTRSKCHIVGNHMLWLIQKSISMMIQFSCHNHIYLEYLRFFFNRSYKYNNVIKLTFNFSICCVYFPFTIKLKL